MESNDKMGSDVVIDLSTRQSILVSVVLVVILSRLHVYCQY